jgi:hypothetical protein
MLWNFTVLLTTIFQRHIGILTHFQRFLLPKSPFHYEDEAVTLNQHVVIEGGGDYEIYRFWVHRFTHSDLNRIFHEFHEAGFHTVNCHNDVIPGSDFHSSDSVTFCTARK